MGILMKFLFIYFFFTLLLIAQESPFSLIKKDTIGELEAKIVAQIAVDILHKDVNIYIVGEQKDFIVLDMDRLKVTKNCQDANFIFISKQNSDDIELCENKKAIFFTDSKEFFNKNREIIGLFYWFKSRPNITFSSKRLEKKSIILPKSYEQYVEEL